MRILCAVHNAYTDSTSGAARSVRLALQWLRDGGHECRVLGTARFDAKPPASLDAHLAELGVPLRHTPPSKAFVRSVKKPANMIVGRPTVDFTFQGVPVTMLLTRTVLDAAAEGFELQQFLFLLDDILHQFQPDVLFTYGAHPVVQEAMRRAKRRGAVTVFYLLNHGYGDRRFFEHVDRTFACSPYLADLYRTQIGLHCDVMEPPIDWAEAEAPADLRRFVTFVNPSAIKGAMLFARLADMLGAARPDIPLLVVQSAATAGGLNAIQGLDFKKYPHIMAAPATPRPADFFALTKILLVPSTFPEPFGMVAAEAMINGIPPLVSDRGALPQTVRGAGRVVPLPDWLTEKSTELPTVEETQPWFDAVCELWDDPDVYAKAAAEARQAAECVYRETVMRRRYLDYFESLDRPVRLFD